MNKFLIYILSSIALLNAAVEPIKDPYKEVEYFVLENGLQVYFLTNKKATNTNISMTINVGWDIENDKNYGLSHLVEHIIFRDKRVPHRDYLDYLKDEGASYVNGFTSRYETELITKIDSNRSYWVTEIFAKMIFDKDVDSEDIEIEKGAVQVEIGELAWYDKAMAIFAKIKKIIPPNDSIYTTHFGLKEPKELPSKYLKKMNNKDFTLDEVMTHYQKYYYPANMILKITGNFDKKKMRSLVSTIYGRINKQGTLRAVKPKRDATLSGKPYTYYRVLGTNENNGYIGTQYLFDDCEKHIILNAFMEYVATKIQQELRNKNGKSYSVSTYTKQSRGAGVVSVSFDGLHDDFNNNIKLIKRSIAHYVKNMDNTMIDEALDEYKKRYTSVEFDSDSLTNLVNKAEHMRSDHRIEDQTHYDFFKVITPEKFNKVLTETFIPENKYTVIYRDYYFFPSDINLLAFLTFLIIIFIYFRFSYLMLSLRGKRYAKREVILSQRISNRFIGLMNFVILVYTTGLVYQWIEYLVMKYLVDDVNYLQTLDMPYRLYSDVLSNFLPFVVMFILLRWVFRHYSRIDITENRLYILGSDPLVIGKDKVQNITVVPWSPNKMLHTLGSAFFFWRPLLKIDIENKTYYIRSSHAEILRSDLMKRWLGKE